MKIWNIVAYKDDFTIFLPDLSKYLTGKTYLGIFQVVALGKIDLGNCGNISITMYSVFIPPEILQKTNIWG